MVESVCPEVINRPTSDVVIELPDDCIGGLLSGDIRMIVRLDRLEVSRYSIVRCMCDGVELELFITGRGGKFFKELTLGDAYMCGFNDLDVFRDSLKERFGCNKLTPLYYYNFKVVL